MWPLLFLWDAGLMSVLIPTLSILAIFILTVNLIRHVTNDTHIPIRDTSKKHNWSSAKLLSKPCYCNVCEALMMTGEGAYCDCCGVCADPGCIKIADKNFRCKTITSSDKAAMKHHWVHGNLPLGSSMCYVCDEECGLETGLIDYCCCWCQRTVHSACRPHMEEVCDFGHLRIHIIPPTCVTLTKKRSVRRKLQLREVSKPSWLDWKPVIVLANRKSGNNDGAVILSMFRRLLNPAQVIDLAEQPPQTALEWCSLLGNVRATVLVAGGDGTIGWVLNAVDNLKLNPHPGVAILPVGTGNDLSRVLGWGKEHEPELDPLLVLDRVQNSKLTSIDRWMVQIQPCRHLGIRLPARSMFMYNYLSVGVDAQVTLDFHRARESPFYIYSSRLINKMLYLTYGTQQVVERGCRDLEKRLELYLDGKIVELPAIESVVVLNIPSWGAGVQMWDMGVGPDEVPPQSYNDGKLEVVALYSSFHIAQLQVGLSQPHRVGQASTVQIKLKATAPIQVDGEPWCQHPADVTISFHNQATVLVYEE